MTAGVTPAPTPAGTCPVPAKLELLLVDADNLLSLGVYCRPHFYRERDALRLAGQRTGVSILDQDGTCCWVGA